MTKEDVLKTLADYLETDFEINRADIVPSAHLYEDLDLDSIDAVDLVVKLQEITGQKIPPEDFKEVRTIGDVVEKVHALINT